MQHTHTHTIYMCTHTYDIQYMCIYVCMCARAYIEMSQRTYAYVFNGNSFTKEIKKKFFKMHLKYIEFIVTCHQSSLKLYCSLEIYC